MKMVLLGVMSLAMWTGVRTGVQAQTYPPSAKAILQGNPMSADGIYTIQPDGAAGKAYPAYCWMSSVGGGWTLGLASHGVSEAPTSDLDLNSANLPQPASGSGNGGTRNVANLSMYNTAQVRFVITAASGEWFDGYYVGRYGPGTTLPAVSQWVLLGGGSFFNTNLLSQNFGQPWTNVATLGTGWYGDGSSLFGTAPSCPANGLTGAGQGPTNANGVVIAKFLIYVREQSLTFPTSQSQLQFYAAVNLTGTTGRTYQVEWASSANTNVWTPLTNFTMQVSPTEILDMTTPWGAPGVNQRFYRGVVVR
jgi:hypothetical protein